MKINTLIRNLLFIILLLLPSWGVITAQIAFLIGFKEIITSIRYLLFFLIIFFSICGLFLGYKRFRYNFGFFILLFYAIYSVAHVIGQTEAILIIEGFRHEVLFVILATTLLGYGCSVKNSSFLPNINTVMLTIFINGVFAVSFGIWQFFDISILELLYREPLEDIGNITLAIGYRLTSTMVNPINFGAYLIIFFLMIQYKFDGERSNLFVFLILSFILFVLVAGSLSRLALLSLSFVFLYSFMFKFSIFRLFILFCLLLSVSFYILNSVDITGSLTRFQTILDLSTYTENQRVSSWVAAINKLEPYQFLWGKGMGTSSPDSSIVESTSAVLVENAFISIFIQYGILGFIFLIAVLSRFFYISVQLIALNRALGQFALGFFIFFVVMCFGNDFFRNSPFVFYFWFFYVFFEMFYSDRVSSSHERRTYSAGEKLFLESRAGGEKLVHQ